MNNIKLNTNIKINQTFVLSNIIEAFIEDINFNSNLKLNNSFYFDSEKGVIKMKRINLSN